MPKNDYWVQEAFEDRKSTGWKKDDNQEKRRRASLKAHKNSALAAGRSLQALANVTQDSETKRKAQADANYFFRMHRRSKSKRKVRR